MGGTRRLPRPGRALPTAAFVVALAMLARPAAAGAGGSDAAGAAAAWSQYGGGAARTHEAALDYGLALYRKWATALPAGVYTVPCTGWVNGEEMVYAGCDDGAVYALDARTGAVKWSFNPGTGAKFRSAPALGDGFLAVAGSDGAVYCLDAATGAERWRAGAGLSVTSPLAVSGDSVIVASGDGRITRIRASDGLVVWQLALEGEFISSGPCAGGGAVFVSTLGTRTDGGQVLAIDEATGSLRWKTQVPGWLGNSAAFSGGRLIIASTGFKTGGIYCLDASSGSILWGPLRGDNNYWSAPAVAGGRVLAGNTGRLYCADLETGAVLWKWEAPSIRRRVGGRMQTYGAIVRTPLVSSDVAYVSTCFEVPGPDELFVVSTASGCTLWRNELPSRPGAGLSAGSGSLLAGGAGGEVMSLAPVTVYVNGVRLPARDAPPLLLDGRAWAPCRLLFEAAGFVVRWDGASGAATCEDGRRSVILTAGSTTAVIDGGQVSLDAGPRMLGNRMMVPVKAVVEALGGTVAWDPAGYSVVVWMDGPASPTGVEAH